MIMNTLGDGDFSHRSVTHTLRVEDSDGRGPVLAWGVISWDLHDPQFHRLYKEP